MKNKLGITLMMLGLMLLMSSAGLMVHNHREETRAEAAAQVLLEQLEQEAPEQAPEVSTLPVLPVLPEPTEMETVEIDGHSYVGELQIPDLELALPILSEWSYGNLMLAPCRYHGNLSTGDLVLLGHNYRSHFGRLTHLTQGAPIYLKDVNDNITAFEVASIEVLQPDQVEEMNAGDYPLTLFTCTYGGQSRMTLRCREKQN